MGRIVDLTNRALRRVAPSVLYVLAPLPAGWWLWQGFTGGLGAEPIRALEQRLGEAGLQLLIAVLAVTPLRRYLGLNLLRFRRALALVGFFYICLHLLAWLALDMNLLWGQIFADIARRPYITVGMLGFVLMVPLALTSSDRAIRRLGPAQWRRLHRLAYPAVLLGACHYLLLVKGWQWEPVIYLAATCVLLALRLETGAGGRRRSAQ
ncbi:sulfoxide reductase heme-binding subunit YedZ [Meinhardsimonia xiamenensis]|jgi:sulfoxide reductase heme-binding subunit YedZ|uniref:Protein-methionine-sulfoxide reductase heme-binding subunit MsrQ n=1 Tax=Meinhardsimonia xiamenensis TaxID=990712 RepID=A0A1G8XPR5_9RHOB|nr:protein-methionine-sulfoxide reductase heme-binding subunit MsrQ [Meinhardsimonia xiamenensis]PRX36993.1 sulfoxide reductase heme-binding subunit YedZ [Meinhardsimonia xiamenensis]SDJ92483.1 sulfoxide reductase heme-binding subunit YedZ [Meinhardsimonia xiamenensis]